jgi:hypothetical protein
VIGNVLAWLIRFLPSGWVRPTVVVLFFLVIYPFVAVTALVVVVDHLPSRGFKPWLQERILYALDFRPSQGEVLSGETINGSKDTADVLGATTILSYDIVNGVLVGPKRTTLARVGQEIDVVTYTTIPTNYDLTAVTQNDCRGIADFDETGIGKLSLSIRATGLADSPLGPPGVPIPVEQTSPTTLFSISDDDWKNTHIENPGRLLPVYVTLNLDDKVAKSLSKCRQLSLYVFLVDKRPVISTLTRNAPRGNM